MNLYDQVKMLFKISNIAMALYNELKYTMKFDSKNVLYIYNSMYILELDFKDIVKKYHKSILRIDRKNKIIYLKKGQKIYLKTINECIRGLDGYRFCEINFKE